MRGASVPASTNRLFWTCLVAACFTGPQALAAGLPEGLAGDWRGMVEVEAGEAPVQAILQSRGNGFAIDISLPAVPSLRAQLVPTDEPHVFQVAASRSGMFSFFNGGDRSNPFDGEPLIWARTSVVGIVAYRLTIAADGGMTLLRIAIEPEGEQLEMAVEQRIDADPRTRFGVLLEPAG